MRAALRQARLEPRQVGFLECHGTGTSLGDPIEVEAIRTVYGEPRTDGSRLWLGAVKSNIGHLEAAAGVAGFIKVVLAMRHGRLPANLHLRHLNPRLQLEGTSIALLRASEPWAGRRIAVGELVRPQWHQRPRGAGGGAAAGGGAGDREFPPNRAVGPEPGGAGGAGGATAGTVGVGSRAGGGRCGVDPGAAGNVRATRGGGGRGPHCSARRAADSGGRRCERRPPGGAVLRTRQPVAADGSGTGTDVSGVSGGAGRGGVAAGPEVGEMLRAPAGSAAAARLEGTWGAQTGLFAMQVALYRLWESWGLQPDYLLGHSIGELTAAHVSGILTLEDACELVKERARLLESLPAGGAMVAVEASDAEVSGETEVEVAAVNGPRSVVLSGEEEAVAAVAARWAAAGRRTRRLAVSHAFHSQRTEPILAELEEVGRRLRPGLGRIPVVSNVTGAIGEAYREPGYWSRQVRMPVRFQEGIKTLERAGVTTYLELGPQGVLCGMGASCVTEGSPARWVAPLRRGKSEVEGTLRAAGELYADGRAVDWQAVVGPLGGRRVSLPTYPFQRERFWYDTSSVGGHPLLGAETEVADSGARLFAGRVSRTLRPWVDDHRCGDVR